MNGKLTISNRTWIIIAAAVLAVIILVAVIKPSEKSGDLSLESYDGKATLTISDVSLGNVDMGDRHLARCKIDRSKDFFKSAVVKHDDFLGSLGMGGDFYPASEKKDTGKALFLVNETLTKKQKEMLQSLAEQGCTFTILGGENAITLETEGLIREVVGDALAQDRIAGSTRYRTSVLIAERYFPDSVFSGAAFFSFSSLIEIPFLKPFL